LGSGQWIDDNGCSRVIVEDATGEDAS
jgi:hypothetical protein